jgi:small conductance mechanosensitive channel
MPVYAASTQATDIASGTTGELVGLIEKIVTMIPLWIAAFIVVLLSILVAKIGRSIVMNKLADSGIDADHQELQILAGRITYATILTLGITIALKMAGIDLTTILAAVAFGIGFALKDMIMNFLAGMMILISRHFTIGDFISVGGTIGKVVDIQSRTTILQAIDGTKVIVPNAELFKKKVISFTSNPFRRIEVVVGVDYRTNLENAVKVCMSALENTHGVLKAPAPAVLVAGFGESSIDLKLRAWVESRGGWLKVKSNLVKNVKGAFDEYGITIPWPIRTVAYDKDQEKVEKIMEQSEAEQSSVEKEAPKNIQVTSQVTLPAEPQTTPLRPLGEK